jgi:hypothetical protein
VKREPSEVSGETRNSRSAIRFASLLKILEVGKDKNAVVIFDDIITELK